MLKLKIYSAKGIKGATVSLPKDFEVKENAALLAQALRVYEDRSHPGLAKVQTRGEVNRTKKKLYKQKGTGGARHGARSAPIFVGGGVAHGPKGVKRVLTLPQKMKNKAFKIALTLKVQDDKVVAVTNLSTLKKTKEAQKLLDKLVKETKVKKTARIVVALAKVNQTQKRFFKNLANVQVKLFTSLNAQDALKSGLLIVDKEALSKK
jgi:large subunit ribosomal protein L4